MTVTLCWSLWKACYFCISCLKRGHVWVCSFWSTISVNLKQGYTFFFFLAVKPIIETSHFPERQAPLVWESYITFPRKGWKTHIFSRKLSHVIYFIINFMCSNILNVKAWSLLKATVAVLLFLITSTCVDMCIRVLKLQLWTALSHPMWILGREIQLGFPESGVGLHALNRRAIPSALTVTFSPLFMLTCYLLYRTKSVLNAEWRCLRILWKSLNNKEGDALYFKAIYCKPL